MRVRSEHLLGKVIKNTPQYLLEDNTLLNNLVLSKTVLHSGQATSGHSHPGLEEIYFFKSGKGTMQLDDTTFEVSAGDIVLVEDGKFHKVFNPINQEDLVFLCVFEKYER